MKKTLIALLAMAGVAMSAQQSITMTDYSATDGFYATSVLTGTQLNSIISTASVNKPLFGLQVELDNDTTFTAWSAVRTWDSRNEFHVYYNQDITAGTSVTSKNVGCSYYATDGYSYPANHAINDAVLRSDATITSAAITFAFAPKDASTEEFGLSVALTVIYDDNTTKTIVGNATGLSWSNNDYWVTDVYYDDAFLTAPLVTKSATWTHDTLVQANEKALGIPEPTTATLSLLALAGLAARRRRK